MFNNVIKSNEFDAVIKLQENIEKVKSMIINELKSDYNYVLDDNMCDIDSYNYVRLFYKEQENWSCYYEIHIEFVSIEG